MDIEIKHSKDLANVEIESIIVEMRVIPYAHLTQIDNIPVQRASCNLGFKPAEYMVTMHWWDN